MLCNHSSEDTLMFNSYTSFSHFEELMNFIRPRVSYHENIKIQQVKITVLEDYVLYHFLTNRCVSKVIKVRREQIPFDISASVGKSFEITDQLLV